MLNYTVFERNSTQFRTCPISGSETRVNPARLQRPMSTKKPVVESDNPVHDQCSIELTPEDSHLVEHLLQDGISSTQLESLFPHYRPFYTENTSSSSSPDIQDIPIPILQFYAKMSPTDALPGQLKQLIEESVETNPFYPVPSLVNNVVQIHKDILDSVKQGSDETIVCANIQDLFSFNPTSSIFNYHIFTQLLASSDTHPQPPAEQQDHQQKWFLHPYQPMFKTEPESLDHPDIPTPQHQLRKISASELHSTTLPSPPFSSGHKLTAKYSQCSDYRKILSTTGQLYGIFKPYPLTDSPPRTEETNPPSILTINFPLTFHRHCSVTQGVISAGETTLFLNKFPFAMHHGCVTVSQAPFVRLKDFTAQQYASLFFVVQQYFNAVRANFENTLSQSDSDSLITTDADNASTIQFSAAPLITTLTSPDKVFNENSTHKPVQIQTDDLTNPTQTFVRSELYPILLTNYLPSSASSLVHPHSQCYVEDLPNPELVQILYHSALYRHRQYHNPKFLFSKPSDKATSINYSSQLNLTKHVIQQELAIFKDYKAQNDPNSPPQTPSVKTSYQTKSIEMFHQPRYITSIPIDCTCQTCNGLEIVLLTPWAPKMNNQVMVYIVNTREDEMLSQVNPISGKIEQISMRYTDITAPITPSTRGHVSSLLELNCNLMQRALGKAFALILTLYREMGVFSYNMACTSAPIPTIPHSQHQSHKSRTIIHTTDELRKVHLKLAQPQCFISTHSTANQPLFSAQTDQPPNAPHPIQQIHTQGDFNDIVLCFTFVSRPLPAGIYANDSGPLERLLQSNVVGNPPEIVAQNMRKLLATTKIEQLIE